MFKLCQLLKDQLKIHISLIPFLLLPAVKRTSLFQELPWYIICNAFMGHKNQPCIRVVYISYVPYYIWSPVRVGFLSNLSLYPQSTQQYLACSRHSIDIFWNKLPYSPMNIHKGTSPTWIWIFIFTCVWGYKKMDVHHRTFHRKY